MSDRFGTCATKREHGSSGPPILVLRDVGGESVMLNNGSFIDIGKTQSREIGKLLYVTGGRHIQSLSGVYVVTNDCAKFRVDFSVIFPNLRPRVTPGWSSGFLVKHVSERMCGPGKLHTCFLEVVATEIPTKRFGRIHVNNTLDCFPTLCEVVCGASHLEIININHKQKIKFGVIENALPNFGKYCNPAYGS